MTKRLLTFDLMRVFAISIILFHHLPNYSFNFYDLHYFGFSLDLSPWNELNRYLGLGIFLFMSGFLLNRKNIKFSGLKDSKKFIFTKFARIFPLYYFALILFFYIYNMNSFIDVIVHVFGLQLIAASHVPVLHTLWFVGLIWIYYLEFLLIKNIKINSVLRAVIFAGFPFIVLFLGRVFGLMDFRLAFYYWVFFFGVFCAENNLFQREVWQKNKFLTPWIFIGVFILAYFLEYNFKLDQISLLKRNFLIGIITISCSLFSYLICDELAKKINFVKIAKAIELIAYSSYCMFLFHRPIWYFLGKFHQEILAIDNPYANLGIATMIGIPLIITISFVLQSLYDRCCDRVFPKTVVN